MPLNDVTSNALTAWAAGKRWKPETRRSYYAAAREFFAVVAPSVDTRAALPVVRKTVGLPRPIPEAVLEAAMRRCQPRERLMLQLAGLAGLRRAEVASVHSSDLLDRHGRAWLRVRGKGGKTRLVPLSEELRRAIETRLAQIGAGWLFPSPYGGHLDEERLSSLAAAVLPKGWSLHTLRHRFATVSFARDRDLLAVQRLLGHTSVATTQVYVEVPEDSLRRAVEAAAVINNAAHPPTHDRKEIHMSSPENVRCANCGDWWPAAMLVRPAAGQALCPVCVADTGPDPALLRIADGQGLSWAPWLAALAAGELVAVGS